MLGLRTGFSPGSISCSRDAKDGDNAGVANRLFARVDQLLPRCEGIAGVEELGLVAEEADRRAARLLAEVLVNQQVDGGLPEGHIVGRVVRAAQAARVDREGVLGMSAVKGDQRLPGFEEVFFRHRRETVCPARLGGIVRFGFPIDLEVDNRPLQDLPECGIGAEDQNAGPGRKQPVLLLGDTGHLLQELDVRKLFVTPRIALRVALPIPADGGRVETALDVEVRQWLAVVARIGGIANEADQFIAGAGVVPAAAPDICLLRIAVQVHRLCMTLRLRDVEHDDLAFLKVVQFSLDG